MELQLFQPHNNCPGVWCYSFVFAKCHWWCWITMHYFFELRNWMGIQALKSVQGIRSVAIVTNLWRGERTSLIAIGTQHL